MPVPEPLRPKTYLNGRGNVHAGGKAWHQERIEQLLKTPNKDKAIYESLGRCLCRFMQYSAALNGLKGDEVYPD